MLNTCRVSRKPGIMQAPPTAITMRAIWSWGCAIRDSRPNTSSE